MDDEVFFKRLVSEFGEHHARTLQAARRDEEAERHIARAEYELGQAQRALRAVLGAMRAPAKAGLSCETAPPEKTPATGGQELVQTKSAAAA